MNRLGKIAVCAALTGFLPAAAHASGARDSAQGFLQGVFARYTSDGSSFQPQGKDADWLFEDSLLALIRQDQAQAKAADEAPILDGDPICGCQEHGPPEDLQIAITFANDKRAVASVGFIDNDDEVEAQYMLSHKNGAWKIDDIVSTSSGSLRELLANELADSPQP